MTKIFDTRVQEIKYNIFKEVANVIYDGGTGLLDIPEKIIPGPHATMRCCIYKERAIVMEKIKFAMGEGAQTEHVVEVVDIACDECPVSEFSVGEACRGCIAHRCIGTCPRGAISIVDQHAVIDNEICIECGKCMNICPYSAIIKSVRPCEKACKANAIDMDENKKAVIDYKKCVGCGACVYQCPFGAIMDKSYIKDTIQILKESQENEAYKVYAVVAPSVSSQFGEDIEIGQIVSGIKKLGFYAVIEAALGADMIAYKEALELSEEGFLTSSCCPAFVKYIEINYPDMEKHVSQNLSPMAEIACRIKEKDPDCKIVFIGPCIAKKEEFKKERVRDIIDNVITFEELQALFDSRDIDLSVLPDDRLDSASFFGRIFARSGGVAEAVGQAVKELGISEETFQFHPIACDGLEACRVAILRKLRGKLPNNFIEGMACINGCIGGAACLTHGSTDKSEVDLYSRQASAQTIQNAIEAWEKE